MPINTGYSTGRYNADLVTNFSRSQKPISQDRTGNVHSIEYDVLGRVVSDAMTTLVSGVDSAVRQIETAYDSQGNAYLLSSYDAAISGTS